MNIKRNVQVGREIVDHLLKENEHRSDEIIAGIEGERFHTHDTHDLVLLLTGGKASPALQIAAMAHDVERFAAQRTNEWYQGDRTGPDYIAYKKRHAEKGAAIMRQKLRGRGVQPKLIDHVVFLISHHDDPSEELEMLHDPELEALVAADSLSWLNFSAPNYFNTREARGIPGLIDKMNFMLLKLPERFWRLIPKITLRESRVLPYLKERVAVVARERGIVPPTFEE